MRYIPASLRSLVVSRAGNRCEYCGLSQMGQAATFHVHHIVPVVEGGQTTADNLALACVSCSLRKAARLRVPDPDSKVGGQDTPSVLHALAVSVVAEVRITEILHLDRHGEVVPVLGKIHRPAQVDCLLLPRLEVQRVLLSQ